MSDPQDGTEAQADIPTVIEGTQLLSQLEQELVNKALEEGLITEKQADNVLETFASLDMNDLGSDVTPAQKTVSVMVEKGLIDEEAGRQLQTKVSDGFVPGYTIDKELGRGAMGVVFSATQTKLDRKVALKVINPALSNDRSYVARFKREALALAKLNHPNIVQVYDYGEADKKIFLALEFVKGKDVQQLLKEEQGMAEERSLQIVRQAAVGLSHALTQGIVHRDVKPANLMVVEDTADAAASALVTKVMDLGLARDTDTKSGEAELTKAGMILGSPAYMAPEQTRGQPADHRSDIYALGASLYHMLTGGVPFSSRSVVDVLVKKRTEKLPDPRSKRPDLSEGLVRVMDRMMARAPVDRYQAYEELITDLDALLSGNPPHTGPVDRNGSSLELTGRVADAAGSSLSATKIERAASGRLAAESSGGAGGAIALVLVLGVLVGVGLLWKHSSKQGGGTGSSSGGAVGAVDGSTPSADAGALVSASLETLESLEPRALLAQRSELDAILTDVERLPEAEKRAARLRFKGIVGSALTATEGETLTAWQEVHEAGDYAKLSAETQRVMALYTLAEVEAPAGVKALAEKAVLAMKDGVGDAERKLWAKVQATEDPLELLTLTEGFAESYGGFSPVTDEVARLRAEAEAKAPRVTLRVEPKDAVLTIDGTERSPGTFEGHLTAGEHEVVARAKDHLDLELRLDVRENLERTLNLGPKPKWNMVQDPEIGFPLWRGESRFYRDWKTAGGQWVPKQGQAGVEDEVEGGSGYETARRDFGSSKIFQRIFKKVTAWSISWELVPYADGEQGSCGATPEQLRSTSAEGRVFPGKDTVLAFGIKAGQVYAAVRTAEGLDQRYVQDFTKPPLLFRVDYDGQILVLWLDGKIVWSLEPGWKQTENYLELAVEQGRVLFRNFKVLGMRPAE